MMADIQAPDLETRVAILSNKARTLDLDLPTDVIQFLAERVTRNVRRMEGALTRVAGVARLMKSSMDVLVDAGLQARQELLEAALSEKNAKTALTLARLEFLPDFSVGYSQNRYLVGSAAPAAGDTKDNSVSIGFNLPVFFWFKQRQDVESAGSLLDAARADRRSAELQTETGIVSLYRTTRLAYDAAVLYRDSLIPLARQDFQVALIAYQSGKVDFTTLSGTLQRIYNARIGYLTAANQFLAGRVALQAAIGRAFPL